MIEAQRNAHIMAELAIFVLMPGRPRFLSQTGTLPAHRLDQFGT
jgi:hypothetical protein